ncbi:MAG TPA: FtsX-like permease family protein, partial [Pseudomonadota bacterium]|nr:FtsX-like permease family protein [Pseudomonadota bacterium]
ANFLALFDMQNMIINMVIAAILVVGGFGILAVQIMIVLQKTRDIAILRSVGLRRRDILLIFLIQGIIVAMLGALIGDVAGWQLVEFLGTLKVKTEALVKTSTFLVYKDPMFYLYGTVFALLTGISASLLPAVRASRVEPVDVLRGQVG